MRALRFHPTLPRAAAAKLGSLFAKRAYTGTLSPLIYGEVPVPDLPSPEWVLVKTRLAGICGSDLAAITLKGSLDNPIQQFISFPMYLGHEIVGEVDEPGKEVKDLSRGQRVAVYPILSCATRDIITPCPPCRRGDYNLCQNLACGSLPPGQCIGTNSRTGGGFSEYLVAHRSQLFRVPDSIPDEAAVLLDPLCVGLHSVLLAGLQPAARVLVVGAGIVGLSVIQVLRALSSDHRIFVVARHPFQKDLARRCGADRIIDDTRKPQECQRLADELNARQYTSRMIEPFFMGGFEAAFDCVGTSHTIQRCLCWADHRGKIVLVGSSPPKRFEWSLLYWKEIELIGSVSYGMETVGAVRRHAFEVALDWMREGRLRTDLFPVRTYPLDAYREAIRSLLEKGASHVVKAAFDFRQELS